MARTSAWMRSINASSAWIRWSAPVLPLRLRRCAHSRRSRCRTTTRPIGWTRLSEWSPPVTPPPDCSGLFVCLLAAASACHPCAVPQTHRANASPSTQHSTSRTPMGACLSALHGPGAVARRRRRVVTRLVLRLCSRSKRVMPQQRSCCLPRTTRCVRQWHVGMRQTRWVSCRYNWRWCRGGRAGRVGRGGTRKPGRGPLGAALCDPHPFCSALLYTPRPSCYRPAGL